MSSDPFVTVRYRWPDESAWSQVKVPGFDASVETLPEKLPADCPNQLFVVSISIAAQLQSGVCKSGPFVRKVTMYPTWGTPEVITSFGSWFIRIPRYRADGSLIGYTPAGEGCRTSEAHPRPKIIGYEVSSVSSNCPVSGCRLKIFDSGQKLIYQEVREGICPEWEIEKPCPPNTLPCGDCCFECGGYISDLQTLSSRVRYLAGKPLIRG